MEYIHDALRAEDIKKVLVLGAGTMGSQISLQCAMTGYDVALFDLSSVALESAKSRMRGEYTYSLTSQRLAGPEKIEEAIGRISFTSDPTEAAKDADLVSESIPEDPELKGCVFAQFNSLCPKRTIFTTNTSTLLPSMFAEATGRPEKFMSLHFHIYVWVANVADVMPHPGTSQSTIDTVTDFAVRIGQIPIQLHKEHSSYVFNTMLGAFLSSAIHLAGDGVASIEDIDRAWMGIMKTPIGPFGIIDFVGLDTVVSINDFWAKKTGNEQSAKDAAFVRRLVDEGRLGVKNMKGFYDYPDPTFARPDFIKK